MTKDSCDVTVQNWPFLPASPYTSPGGEWKNVEEGHVRDGSRKIIASVTSGFSDTSAVIRDEGNRISGRTNERFHTTRDAHGNLVSLNSADAGLLIGRKK